MLFLKAFFADLLLFFISLLLLLLLFVACLSYFRNHKWFADLLFIFVILLEEKTIKCSLHETLFNGIYVKYALTTNVSHIYVIRIFNQKDNNNFTDKHINQEHVKLLFVVRFGVFSNLKYINFFIVQNFTLLFTMCWKKSHYMQSSWNIV